MPYTLNGIGTIYVGRRNKSVAHGRCEFCGRDVTLSFYDTREFFCLVFVPLIPLRKFRIQNDCSSCHRHYRIPYQDFRRAMETQIQPLQEAVRCAPGDPRRHLELANALVGLRMLREAEGAARAGVEVAPADAELNHLVATLMAGRGEVTGAVPFLSAAAASAPQDGAIRRSLGRSLAHLKRLDEAARELAEARRLEPGNTDTLWLLGECYLGLSRTNEALEAFQDLMNRQPDLAHDRGLLAKVKQCKAALGYPITDEERRAARRWWPFRRKSNAFGSPRPARAGSQVSWRRIAAFVIVLLGVAIVYFAGVPYWNRNHQDLYLDNGLKEALIITVDGESISLVPGEVTKKTLRPGTHVIVTRTQKKEIEKLDGLVSDMDLWEALSGPPIYVYNPLGTHIYQRQSIGYSTDPEHRSYSESYVAFERFFAQTGVDYAFQEPPETISTGSRSSVVTRVAFNIARDVDYNDLAGIRYTEGNPKEAERALRKAIELDLCHEDARGNLVWLLADDGRLPESLAEARAWMIACPVSIVESHRVYQNVRLQMGDREALLREYATRLREHPEDGTNHYLYGRLLDDPSEELPHYREALQKDPSLVRAQTALGHTLLKLERFTEALPALETAYKSTDYDPELAIPCAWAAIGAGDADRVGKDLEARLKSGGDESLWQACFVTHLARRDWVAADRMVREKERDATGQDTPWVLRAQFLRLAGRRADLMALLDSLNGKKLFAGQMAAVRFEVALENGDDLTEAVARLDQDMAALEQEPSTLHQLYQVSSLLLAGNISGAAARLRSAEKRIKEMGEGPEATSFAAMAEVLGRKGSPEEVLRVARKEDLAHLKHAYFFLAVHEIVAGNRTAARELFRKSERASVDQDFPLLAARRLAR